MNIIETGNGVWVKDGERYKLQPSKGQTGAEMKAEAEVAGYVLSPLTPEERAYLESIPSEVSKLALAQAIFADSGLRLMSLLTLVPVEMKDEVEEFLVLSQHIERSHPQIAPLGALLGYDTPAKLDAIFTLAKDVTI
tara:strand:- start:78 stop:488 length:411 start_codon:yes stop_codon:yes gene_type:complete